MDGQTSVKGAGRFFYPSCLFRIGFGTGVLGESVQKVIVSGEALERGMECNLKPFEVVQRVQLPPGKGAARQPEASLAGTVATPFLKRRQRTPKP